MGDKSLRFNVRITRCGYPDLYDELERAGNKCGRIRELATLGMALLYMKDAAGKQIQPVANPPPANPIEPPTTTAPGWQPKPPKKSLPGAGRMLKTTQK